MAQSGEAPAQSMAEHVQETTSTEVPLHRWVLKYGDKVYGPYTFEAMKGYVAEGRVAEHSLIAPEGTPAGASMWQYAVDIPAFTPLFAVTPEEQTLPAGEPTAEDIGAAADEPAGETTDMQQAIMSLGPAYKLAPNVWCVNTDATAAGLLNDLSQHIGRTDTMFIADTTRDRTAWSSMGPEVDAKIRRVWRRTY